MNSSTTLYEFHKKMIEDMDLPHDSLIQFKALDRDAGLVARYGTFNLGAGTVDEVSVAETVRKGVASFVYFYDVTSRKSLVITFEQEKEGDFKFLSPVLVETKGPNPVEFENGYVAYEDLPDDQKHLPGESAKAGKPSKDDDDDDDDDIDLDEDDDDDDDDADDDDDEDGQIIYDGSEELNI